MQTTEGMQSGDGYRGRLWTSLGFATGVGRTYGMLTEACELLMMRERVVVGYIEPHDHPDTSQLLEGLSQTPPKNILYK